MKRTLRQSLAVAWSEYLRMATSPAWAILLFLWTLVCGLFFQIVINYAAANALPAGETPMSYFFRTAPFLLPLLLIVFVPQLTMDVVAGRRERRRMEHLLISGLHPGALIIGAFVAICGLLLLLIIPPLLFHGIIAMHAEPDIGKTLSALISLLFIGASIAALGLCISCWAPHRLAASLVALSIGIAWWIIDVFGQQIDQADNWESWRAALAMALTIYDSASGLLEPRLLLGFSLLTLTLLYIARCGLDWHRYPRARLLSAAMGLLLGTVFIVHAQQWHSRWDMTAYNAHSLNAETQSLSADLIEGGGLQITLSSTPAMRSDAIDGPIYERCLHMFRRLSGAGLRLKEMDPALDPEGTLHLSRELSLESKDWQHPLVIVRHLNNSVILKASQLGVHEQRDGETVLKALRCESALLAALHYLKDGQQRYIAWLHNEQVRDLSATILHKRNLTMQSAFQSLKSDGYAVQPVEAIHDVNQDTDLLLIPGPRKDLSQQEAGHIHQLLRSGTSVLLLLDGREDSSHLEELHGLLQDFGITPTRSAVYQRNPEDEQQMLHSFPVYADDKQSTLGAFHRKQFPFVVHWGRALQRRPLQDPDFISSTLFQSNEALFTKEQDRFLPGANDVCFLSIAHSRRPEYGHFAVCGSVDSFSDGALHLGYNRQCLSLLTRNLLRRPLSDTLPPQAVQAHRFSLSTAQKMILIWCVGIGLPLFSAGLGGCIAWRRRRQ